MRFQAEKTPGQSGRMVMVGLLCLLPLAALAERVVDAGYGRLNADPNGAPTVWWVGGSTSDCSTVNLQFALTNAADGDTVLVARDGNYAGQGFDVHGKGLTIRGGYDSCQSDPNSPSGRTQLDATGAGRPVIDFFSSSNSLDRRLILENLGIGGGTAYEWAGAGGGILVEGPSNRMSLILRNTAVWFNEGPSGAGIYLNATGVGTNLNFWFDMDAASEIRDNEATSGTGGGLLCSATLNTIMNFVRINGGRISGNTANLDGGGIHARGCRTVLIQPKRVEVNDGIWGNQAGTRGGAIFASDGAQVTVFGYAGNPAVDPGPQVAGEIFGNQATTGGAVAAIDDDTVVTVSNVVTHGNSATFGGAFASLSGARLVVRRPDADSTDCTPFSGSLLVPGKPPCSLVIDNQASERGGAFHVNSAQLVIDRSHVVSNSAVELGGAINAERTDPLPDDPDIEVTSSVFSANSGNGIFSIRNTEMLMVWSTVTGNQPASFTAIMNSTATGDRLSIVDVRGSILWEPGETLIARVPVDPGSLAISNAECVIGSDPDDSVDFGGLQYYSQIDPRFRDLDALDFRLSLDSPAIDYCDGMGFSSAPDLAGRARGTSFDLPVIEPPNPGTGPFDLGAWEQPRARIFHDRFEQDQ